MDKTKSRFGVRAYLQVLLRLLPRVRELSLLLLQLGDEVVLVNQLLLQPADLRVFNYDVFLALLESGKSEGKTINHSGSNDRVCVPRGPIPIGCDKFL